MSTSAASPMHLIRRTKWFRFYYADERFIEPGVKLWINNRRGREIACRILRGRALEGHITILRGS